jgi:FKBP12-rapamycin complex-associated protein
MWIKFANLCRSSERMTLADKTINSLLSPVSAYFDVDQASFIVFHQSHARQTQAPPDVVYTQLKFMWANDAQEDSLLFLRQFTATIADDLEAEARRETDPRSGVSQPRVTHLSKLLARCYFKLGEWESQLRPDWASVSLLILEASQTHGRYSSSTTQRF